MDVLTVAFNDRVELYRCYMPFLKNGGLFIHPASEFQLGHPLTLAIHLPDTPALVTVGGNVAWYSPAGGQSTHPEGIGVAFTDDKDGVSDRIKKIISSMQGSNVPTYTM